MSYFRMLRTCGPHRAALTCQPTMSVTGAPGGIRTPNPQIRSLMLCPVELQAPRKLPLGSNRSSRSSSSSRRTQSDNSLNTRHLLKIDDLQAFFKKEPVKRRRDLAVGDEHRTLR